MMHKYLIIEDETHSRENLAMLMKSHPDFELTGSASSLSEAKSLLNSTVADLIFLDIILRSVTGFDLLSQVNIGHAEIIFITSHEGHALKAIKASALDYLLKPIASDELANALTKFREAFKAGNNSGKFTSQLKIAQEYSTADQETAQIALPTLSGFNFVYVKDIVRCESDNTYTTFHFTNQKPLIVSRTLKEWEMLLSEHKFFRVHNSHLVNKRHIVEYKRGEGGLVIMTDNSHVDVSRRRKEEFMTFMIGPAAQKP
jgi:two-component system LytT family response regulator